jgi:hypothetical protein
MRRLLDVEIGEDAQERRADVDSVTPRQAVETLELGEYR